MRIIAGTWRGRTLLELEEPQAQSRLREAQSSRAPTIRPTSDKVRGAIFNIIQHGDFPVAEDTRVLDGFCGSGALGLEALSRGAAFALFLDSSMASLQLAKSNAETFKAQKSCAFEMRDLARPQTWRAAPFNLVFLDPPYGKNLCGAGLKTLTEGGFIAPHALAVAETAKGETVDLPAGWELGDTRSWGVTAAHFLTYNK
jgi:16S rRNA (guanine966-N2)-methyltransferase